MLTFTNLLLILLKHFYLTSISTVIVYQQKKTVLLFNTYLSNQNLYPEENYVPLNPPEIIPEYKWNSLLKTIICFKVKHIRN